MNKTQKIQITTEGLWKYAMVLTLDEEKSEEVEDKKRKQQKW